MGKRLVSAELVEIQELLDTLESFGFSNIELGDIEIYSAVNDGEKIATVGRDEEGWYLEH